MQSSAGGDAARVQLWIARPAAITDQGLLARYRAALSRDEDARMGRLQVSIAKRFLVTRALVRWALSQAADVAPAAWRFADNDHGKPHIAGPDVSPPLFFNLSHSGDLVVCAVTSHGPVGADVEFLERGRRFTEVADRFFAPSEASSVRARRGAEQRVEFYRSWTLKESYVKARGLGIALPLAAFWFEGEDTGSPRICFDQRIEDDPGAWRFWQARIGEDHLAAVALRCGEGVALEVEVSETTPRFDPPAADPEK